MRMFEASVYLVYIYIFVGCAAPKMTGTSSTIDPSRYSEDLTTLRPKVELPKDTVIVKNGTDRKATAYVEPKHNIDPKLNPILDSIDRINLSRKFVEGYTIQVYSGKREEALNTRKQLTSLVPEVNSEVLFTEPIFRVKAGKYFTWIEAQGDYTLIKKYFPAAIIIPDKIPTE
jgi:hypothetical protein